MNRDGHSKSIWQDNIPDYQPLNNWDKETVYDVLIVGAGVTGLTAALLLQQQGRQCIIAEAHTVGFGTSSGTTAHLNTTLDVSYDILERDFGAANAALVADASRAAIDLIEELITKHEIDCGFTYQSGYLFAQDEQEEKELQQIIEATARAGVIVNESPGIPVPLPFTKAAMFGFQAQFHPTKYILALAKVFEAAGGVILQHCVVGDVTEEETVTAATTLGEIKADNLIYATHIPPGINLLHFRCTPYRSYAMAFTLKDDQYPDGLAYDLKEPYNYFRTHEIDGQKYVISGGFDHKTGGKAGTEHIFTELEAFARKYFKVDTVAYRWSSQYYNSADGLPYIGLLPGHNKIYTGTGYSGNGFIFGTLTGKMLCDAITAQPNDYADLFRPARVKPFAGFAEFVKHNAHVVSQFTGKRFAYEKIATLAALGNGEATVAEWDGKKVALYKDENGKVSAVDPVCPHAGCIVGWNSAEQSWDCPCHGGRYAPTGELLNGPATRNLTPLMWEAMDGD